MRHSDQRAYVSKKHVLFYAVQVALVYTLVVFSPELKHCFGLALLLISSG